MLSSTFLIAASLAGGLTSTSDTTTSDPVETILVHGARGDASGLESLSTPGFGVGVTDAQIAAVNAFNVEDSFKYAPNLIVRKRYIGDNNATLSFRSMHTTQTPRALVSIDGFTISNFLGASFNTAPKWGVLAPGDIDRVEIMYGPSSARYSGHAMGGALLMSLREVEENQARLSLQAFQGAYDYYATDETLTGWSIDGGLDYRLGDRGFISLSYRHFENEGQPQQWRTLVNGSQRQALIDQNIVAPDYFDRAIRDDELGFLTIGGEDSVVKSEEDQLRLRAQYDLTPTWRVRALLALLKDEERADNPKSFLRDGQGQPSLIGLSGVRQSSAKDLELLIGVGLRGEISGWNLDIAASRFDVLDNAERQSDTFDYRTGLAPIKGQVEIGDATAWTHLDVIAQRTFGRHDIALGASYAGYHFDTPRYNTPNWRDGSGQTLANASGGKTALYGVFIEDAVSLTPSWTATLGLRAEHWRAQDGYLLNGATRVDYASREEDALSPKAALSFTPNEAWSLSASVAMATRFPTVGELYQASLIAYGPNVGELNFGAFNPHLKPEEAVDYQLSATRRFEHAALTVSLFKQDVSDSLFAQTVPELATSLTTNIDKIETQGVDFVLGTEDFLIEGLSLDANLSLIEAEVTKNAIDPSLEGNTVPRVPSVRANISLRYSPNEAWLLAAGWRYQDTPERNIENNATSKCGTFYCVSDFSIIDVKATRHFENFDLSLGVDNLNDERAFVYHPYPGRTVMAELRWRGGF
ncbi:TonB-dependent receptor [Woodsholea maritima]|uniref:TonB-dependent receptor n=1 Tax=Woodsholea maritima TaxID=240237 RepID=UPI000378E74C|nr:TonB-dependent receptor [Woodsholea maritima]